MSLEDSYGKYTPSPPFPPTPPFPCEENPNCTANNRLCGRHKSVLFVKFIPEGNLDPIEIPFGKWENWAWYAERISEATGLVNDGKQFRMIFAGVQHPPSTQRHSGLQTGASIHCVIKKDENVST